MSNLDRMRKDLDRLSDEGDLLYYRMLFDLDPDGMSKTHKKTKDELSKNLQRFDTNYQRWYSESMALLSVLLPDRVADFKSYYQLPRPPKELNYTTYTISDYLKATSLTRGIDKFEVVGPKAAVIPMQQQVAIVRGARARFESSLFDIRGMAQADLFDNELDASAELNRNGFARGAGAVAGVVLEGHLATVCSNHSVSIAKKRPTIADFNDALKAANVIDQATWRYIQHLGDIRNACDHKGKDPTKEAVDDLINGVRKLSKTVF
ncbi:hypothetical protein [Bradyrhizobium brasilense]|nr:hypothetical protein [Bradyrhizobium brasilense]